MKAGDWAASHATAGVLRLVALLPLAVSQAIGRLIGICIYYLNTRAAKVTATNIRICLPGLSAAEQRKLARESLCQTGQMMMESPAAWLGSISRVSGWIREVCNQSLLDQAIALQRGVIVVLPHIGNWELINAYFAVRSGELGGLRTAGLYAPPGKTWLRPIMAEIRERFGNEMMPTTAAGLARAFRLVGKGGLMVILPDQVPARGGFAPFFGVDCLTDRLIPRLLARTHARVVCCVIERLPCARGFRIIFSEPHSDLYSGNPEVSLKGLNESVEQCVRQVPPQYQWEYKRFKERPAGELRIYNYENEPWTHH
jgi:KDO2-lipid IV(A) lauroyltransferase